MADNMMQMLADVPPTLIVAWTVWFIAGGMLAMWYRRASLEAEFAPAPAPAPRTVVARPRPAARPASAPVAAEESVFAESAPVLDESPMAARDKRGAKPLVVGDPYGDLATLLDQPSQAAPPAPSYRTPSDSPILNSAGSPVLRNDPDRS